MYNFLFNTNNEEDTNLEDLLLRDRWETGHLGM